MTMQELDSLLKRSEKLNPMPEIVYPAEQGEKLNPMPEIVYPAEQGEKLNPIILASGTSEKDAIRIAKDLGRVLGHNRAQIIHSGKTADIEV